MVDLYELRRILECEAAALAAERHGDAHLRLMDAAIEEMAKGLESTGPERAELYIDGDLRFHLAIAEATRNGVILHTMRALRELIRARAHVRSSSFPRAPSARRSSTARSATRSPRATPSRARDEMRDAPRARRVRHPPRVRPTGSDAWLSSGTSASA